MAAVATAKGKAKARTQTPAPAATKPKSKTRQKVEQVVKKSYNSGYTDSDDLPTVIGLAVIAAASYGKGVSDGKKAEKIEKRRTKAKK